MQRLSAEGAEYRLGAAVSPVAVDGPTLIELPLEDGTVLGADAFVFACGPWLAVVVSGCCRRQCQRDAPGGLLLRHAGRGRTIHGARPASVDGLCRRFPIGSDLWNPGLWLVRIQSRRRRAGSGDRSHQPRARSERRRDRSRPCIPVAPVSGSCRRASGCLGGLSVPKYAGRSFHRRPASRRVQCVDCWRRLWPWL